MDIYKCPKSKKFYKYKFQKKRDFTFKNLAALILLKNRKILTIYAHNFSSTKIAQIFIKNSNK